MKELVREFIIYQLIAVVLTLLAHQGSEFFVRLPGYLVITNCIAWSIRTIFLLASLRLDFMLWRRHWQILFILPAAGAGCFAGVLIASLIFKIFFHQSVGSSLLLAIFKGALPGAIIVTILLLIYHTFRDRMETHAVENERLKGSRHGRSWTHCSPN